MRFFTLGPMNLARTLLRRGAHAALVLTVAPTLAAAQNGGPVATYDSATAAWATGDYVDALTVLDQLLAAPSGESLLDSVALLTGEMYRTRELAPDGRNVRWSADGRRVLIDAGIDQPPATTVLTLGPDGTVASRTTIAGAFGATISPDGKRVAYLVIDEDAQLRAARARLDTLRRGGDRRAIIGQLNAVATLERSRARIAERDVSNGKDRRLHGPAAPVAPLAYAPNGTLFAVARAAGTPDTARAGVATTVYAVPSSGAPKAVTTTAGPRASFEVLPDGKVMYLTSNRTFAILDPATGAERAFSGTAPSLSADGSAVVFIGSRGDTSTVNVVRLANVNEVQSFTFTRDPISRAAMAADGRTIVVQAMPDHDWELFVLRTDSAGQIRRLTREIQHDLFPRWVAGDRILEVLGEARHRRSYLLDPATGARTRLFHNNMLRTVSMEYEWVPSPDGSKLLVVAERDGNTISTERGVYLVDLSSKVTVGDVRQRIADMLATERDLRARGEAMFAPIAAAVRDAVADVSVARIYQTASTVHGFGSKYITQPGNRKAIEYYERRLREFGYEPELQWFEPRPGVRTANIIARLPGTVNPELLYVVSSHFDSVEDGPGADDNSSGSSALLEAARVLANRPQAATIVFALFTGEEAGLLGSREFVRRAVAAGDKLVGALNNDMIGWSGDARLDNTIRYSNDGLRDLQHAAAIGFTDLVTYDARYYKSTDAHAYYEAYGDIVAGIGSYPILSNPHYHQSHDILATIDQRLVAEVSKTTIASLMLMASSPSRLAGLTVSPLNGNQVQVQWTASPEKGIRAYQVSYGAAGASDLRTITVTEPRATLSGVEPGWVVHVRAESERGTTGWDWARATIR